MTGQSRILADVADVARFPDRNHFASWTGTAPLDASSGEQIRHRLSRAGNRRMNHVLHMAAVVQLRNDTDGRAYYRHKLTEAKTSMEALRYLKRRLSDVVYRATDHRRDRATHKGGFGRAHQGDSSIQRGRPAPGNRLFGQATTRTRSCGRYPPQTSAHSPAASGTAARRSGAPEVSTWSAPPDERR